MVLFEGIFGILIRLVYFSSVTNYYLMVWEIANIKDWNPTINLTVPHN